MSRIPPETREGVRARDGDRCVVCGGHGYEVHHRRRRREGGHGLENCIQVCRTCHRRAHAEPVLARDNGWIVSAYDEQVAQRPIRMWWGWALLTPTGQVVPVTAPTREELT